MKKLLVPCLVFLLLTLSAGMAYSYTISPYRCTDCHLQDPSVAVTATFLQCVEDQWGLETEYAITISDTYDGQEGWAIFGPPSSNILFSTNGISVNSATIRVVDSYGPYTLYGTSDRAAAGEYGGTGVRTLYRKCGPNACIDSDGDDFNSIQNLDCGPIDCNDNDAAIKPGATEIGDLTDNDCDGTTDEGCPQMTYYRDADGDGFGAAADAITITFPAAPPAGYVMDNQDCNDLDETVYPGASEIKHDGIDQDCNDFDLTIDVVKAACSVRKATLVIEATSDLGNVANLRVRYQALDVPMVWSARLNRWTITLNASCNAGSVIEVYGSEGTVTTGPTSVK